MDTAKRLERLSVQIETWTLGYGCWYRCFRCARHGHAFSSGPDFNEIVDRACCDRDAEPVLQCGGSLLVGPTALPERADQVGVRLQFAGGRLGVGLCEEVGDFLFEAHIDERVSTYQPIRAPSASGSMKFDCIRGRLSWKFGYARTRPNLLLRRSRAFEPI